LVDAQDAETLVADLREKRNRLSDHLSALALTLRNGNDPQGNLSKPMVSMEDITSVLAESKEAEERLKDLQARKKDLGLR